MASRRSRLRVRRSTATRTPDRISNLPDGVLSHILSFLPTEDSVRTRSLSTRWKHLFAFVPLLDFTFPSSTKHPLSCSRDPDAVLAFLDFVDEVFTSYNVNKMESLKFKLVVFDPHPDNYRLLSWIPDSVRRGVRKLIISVPFPKPQKLPTCVFTCQTITYLCLRSRRLIIDAPEDVCLPQLKTLDTLHLQFIDADSLRRFFRGCLVLENLCLEFLRIGDIHVFDISVPSLKSLTINQTLSKGEFHLVFNLPKIENFTYISTAIRTASVSFHGFELLVEANISFNANTSQGCKALYKLVSVVSNARKLSFPLSTLENFQRFAQIVPLFCNLTHLEISHLSDLDSGLVLDLLDKTPRLEILVVENVSHVEECEGSGVEVHFSPERVPACVSHNLKEVRFEGLLISDLDFAFMKYVFENAKVLETLKIWPELPEKQLEMSKKLQLLTFSRCARACQIVVNPYLDKILGLSLAP